jgi:hypothetical protein
MKMVVRHAEPEDYEALRRIFSSSRIIAGTLHSSSELQPRRFAWLNILGAGIKRCASLDFSTTGDERRLGPDSWRQGRWASTKIGSTPSHTERVARFLYRGSAKSARSPQSILLALLSPCRLAYLGNHLTRSKRMVILLPKRWLATLFHDITLYSTLAGKPKEKIEAGFFGGIALTP